jgi:hypothetical protein
VFEINLKQFDIAVSCFEHYIALLMATTGARQTA